MHAPRNDLPRVLVTGFEPFPGAPVNPTEAMVRRLREAPLALDGMAAFRAELLPVDYGTISPRLSEIGKAFVPDIAIHFGLARDCRGFRLERVARNRYAHARPDNFGTTPAEGRICIAPPLLEPTLPLLAIHDALMAEGLPVEWSDDAGGYLCNVAMTLSLASACDGFAPALSGFIHVPMVGEGFALTMQQLMRGVEIAVRTAVQAWPRSASARSETGEAFRQQPPG